MQNISEKELERLKKSLQNKDKEIERLGRNRIGWKTILSLIVILFSVLYYIKTKDENVFESKEKSINEIKFRDQRINDLNKQLEIKEKNLNDLLKKSQTMDQNINNLNKQIGLKDKQLIEVSNKSDLKNKKITELENNLLKTQNDSKEFETNCLKKDKQINSLREKMENKVEMYSKKLHHRLMVLEAQTAEPVVIYFKNITVAKEILSETKQTLMLGEEIYRCYEDPNEKFDVYRNCFRDMAIALHQRLYGAMGPNWVITIGSNDQCFTINIINEKEREEYFFTIGNLYFEIFRYYKEFLPTNITTNHSPEDVVDKDVDQNVDNNADKNADQNVDKIVDKNVGKNVDNNIDNKVDKKVDKNVVLGDKSEKK